MSSAAQDYISSTSPIHTAGTRLSRTVGNHSLAELIQTSSAGSPSMSTAVKDLFPAFLDQSSSTSSKAVGLSIALPIGIFALCLLIFFIFFYFKKNKILSSATSQSPISDFCSYKKTRWFPAVFGGNDGASDHGEKSRDLERGINGNISVYPFHEDIPLGTEHKISDSIPNLKPQVASQHLDIQELYAEGGPEAPRNTLGNLESEYSSSEYPVSQTSSGEFPRKPQLAYTLKEAAIKPQVVELGGGKERENGKKFSQFYETPLSRWFLRSSTYFRDTILDAGGSSENLSPRKTLTFPLKQLKILRRVNRQNESPESAQCSSIGVREDVGNASFSSKEKETLLDLSQSSSNDEEEEEGEKVEGEASEEGEVSEIMYKTQNHSKEDTVQFRKPATFRGGINLDRLVITNKSNNITTAAGLQPLEGSVKSQRGKEKDRNIKYQQKRQEYISDMRALAHGCTVNTLEHSDSDVIGGVGATVKANNYEAHSTEEGSSLKLGLIYVVVKEYIPKLDDEIRINVGEYVRILATHTDGWCLVEKCSREGGSTSVVDPEIYKESFDEFRGKYLNEDRGIVPGDCLQFTRLG